MQNNISKKANNFVSFKLLVKEDSECNDYISNCGSSIYQYTQITHMTAFQFRLLLIFFLLNMESICKTVCKTCCSDPVI